MAARVALALTLLILIAAAALWWLQDQTRTPHPVTPVAQGGSPGSDPRADLAMNEDSAAWDELPPETSQPPSDPADAEPADSAGAEEDSQVPDDCEETSDAEQRLAEALLVVDEGLVPDPVEEGDCTLWLEVADEDTGRLVASRVDLWRLDAPTNENYGRGDQVQLRVAVPRGGIELMKLPRGWYRAVCGAARAGSEDYPSFPLHTGKNRMRVAIPLPASAATWVQVFDHEGQPIQRAQWTQGSTRTSGRSLKPDWLRPRPLLVEPPSAFGIGGSAGSTGGRYRIRSIRARGLGFSLGSNRENSKEKHYRYESTLAFENGASARIIVQGEDPLHEGGRHYVAVAVPPELVLEHLTFEGGPPILEGILTELLTVRSEAILTRGQPAEPLSRQLKVRVEFLHPDFDRLLVSFTLAELPGLSFTVRRSREP